ncbi:MAG: hypothetical protein V1660_02015 [archaeon]
MSNEFIFADHIKKADFSKERSSLEERLKNAFFHFKKEYIINRIKRLNEIEKLTDNTYPFIEWFFEEMASHKYCKAEYDSKRVMGLFGNEICMNTVTIKGEGIEDFPINGKPTFNISRDKRRKESVIPVLEGSREANLILYDYPLCDLPLFGKLETEYEFETYFSLGWTDKGKPFNFTKDILNLGSFLSEVPIFYGEPGKVNYRVGDGLHDELMKSVLPKYGRERLNLSVRMYIDGKKLFYQGNMESSGTFPFFISKDRDGDRQKRMTPKAPYREPVGV